MLPRASWHTESWGIKKNPPGVHGTRAERKSGGELLFRDGRNGATDRRLPAGVDVIPLDGDLVTNLEIL